MKCNNILCWFYKKNIFGNCTNYASFKVENCQVRKDFNRIDRKLRTTLNVLSSINNTNWKSRTRLDKTTIWKIEISKIKGELK